MAGNTTRSEANESLFVVVRDPNTNVVRRIAFPADIQIGLDDQPAEMHLLGRLAIAAKVYAIDGVNQGLIGMTNNDTVVALTVNVTPLSGRITCTLPPDPRDGQIHFIKDYSGTASTIPIDIVPSPGTTIDNVTVKTLSDPYGSLAVIWLEDQWRILVAGIGSSGGAGAPTNASFVTINSETSLSAERRLTGSANILMTDQGPGASVFFNLSQILGGGAGTYTYATVTADAFGRITGISNGITPPSPSHSFLTAQSEAGLSNERVMSGGLGTTVTDGGTTFAFHVNPLVVPFLTGANVFTSPNTFNAGLSGSLTRLPSGVTYLVGIGGITITTGSNGQVFISGSSGGGGGGGSGGGDPGASYLVVGTTASLSNERQVQAGYGIAFQDGGANGNFIISAIGSLSQSGGGGSSGAVLQTSSSNQWVTAYEVNFKTQTSGVFGGNGNQTFNGATWTVENYSNARWFGINPQTGLQFDPNTTNTDYGFGTNRSAPLLGTRVTNLFPQFSLPDHRLRAWGLISSHNANQDFEKIGLAFERYGAAGDWGVMEGLLFGSSQLGWQIQANHGGSNVLNQSNVTLQNTHNVIMLQFNHERSVDVYTGLAVNGQWPNTGSLLFRGNVMTSNAVHFLNNLTGSGELGIVMAVGTNNTNGNLTGSFWKFRLDYEVTSSLLAATTLDVVTASQTNFINIATTPTWTTLCAITSSMSDVLFWGKLTGVSAGANTVHVRLTVDGNFPTTVGDRGTYIETVTSGAGWGGAINGRITGLTPNTSHIFALEARKGTGANQPGIDPKDGTNIQGTHLMLMNLTQSMSTPAPQFIVSGSGGSGIAGINLSGSGTPVSGNPFANLNFTGAGVSVSNAGNGVATINIPGASGSSGGAGEVSASYVVLGLTSSLANERVLTGGYGIGIQDGGPGGAVIVSYLGSLSSSGGGTNQVLSSSLTGSWQLIYDRDLATLPSQSFVLTGSNANPVLIDGIVWYLENQANADAVGILPGNGLVIDLNGNATDYNNATRTCPMVTSRFRNFFPTYNHPTDEVRTWFRLEITGSANSGNNILAGFDKLPPYVNTERDAVIAFKGLNPSLSWYIKNRFGSTQEDSGALTNNSSYDVVMLRQRGKRQTEVWIGQFNTAANTWPQEDQMYLLTVSDRLGASAYSNNSNPITSSLDSGFMMGAQSGGTPTTSLQATFKRIRLDVKSENSSSIIVGATAPVANTGSPQAFWLDDGPDGTYITGSVAIGTGTRATSAAGQEAFLFVSGTIGLSGSVAKKAIFGGDVFISGSLRGSGSCLITTASLTHIGGNNRLNLSTTGTIDWFAPGGTYSQNYRGTNTGYGKVLGGLIHESFDWYNSNAGTSFTQASGWNISSTAGDSDANTNFTNVTTDQGIFTGAGTDFGFRFRAPAGPTRRTMRIYMSAFSAGIVVTVRTPDGSFPDTQYFLSTGAAGSLVHCWDIAYNTVTASEIYVRVNLTTNLGSSPNIKMAAVTVQ